MSDATRLSTEALHDGEPRGGCVEEQRVATELCAAAARSREVHLAAQASFREARGRHEDAMRRLREAAMATDANAVRAAKDAAWRSYQAARDASSGPGELEAATRDWLMEIDRINRSVRDAAATASGAWPGAAALITNVEQLAREVELTRTAAERDAEACRAARVALAACEETQVQRGVADPASVSGVTRVDVGGSGDGARRVATGEGLRRVIDGLLAGDRALLGAAAARIALDLPEPPRRAQLLLADLIDALTESAMDAGYLRASADHEVWRLLAPDEARAVMAALAQLGFRSSGRGGYTGPRPINAHDLRRAIVLAGLDPMRLRPWPDAAAVATVFDGITVGVSDAVRDAAPDLALAELTAFLGNRAEPLEDLWHHWGRIRPTLLLPAAEIAVDEPEEGDDEAVLDG